MDEVDEGLLTQLAYNARGDICPMQGVIGGITAQEVMKVHLSLLPVLDSYIQLYCQSLKCIFMGRIVHNYK